MISETAYTNDGVCSGRSDESIGGLVMRRCDCDYRSDGRDAGTVDIDVDVSVE